MLSWLEVRRSRHYVTHTALTASEGRYIGTADSASYADCRRRAAAERHAQARANEHFAVSKPRGGGDSTRRKSEEVCRISPARPGRCPLRLESRGPGGADGA